jgi:uncharacterized phage-like protein YoqJ
MTAAVTGHRPEKIGGYNSKNPVAKAVRRWLREQYRLLIEEGYDKFWVGMAIGVDTYAAKILLKLREEYPHIQVCAAVPFMTQPTHWKSQNSQKLWRELLMRMDWIKDVRKDRLFNPEQLKEFLNGAQEPPHYIVASLMNKRNEFMVDESNLVLAVWDGSSGGTSNCVMYARSTGKPVRRFNPTEIAVND